MACGVGMKPLVAQLGDKVHQITDATQKPPAWCKDFVYKAVPRALHILKTTERLDVITSVLMWFNLAGAEPPTNSRIIKQSGGVSVYIDLIIADITDIKADVIVNSVGKEKDLSSGKLSKALLDRAGDGLQESLNSTKVALGKLAPGEVAVTPGYKLRCREVYHCCLPQYTKEKKGLSDLSCVVSRCLNLASSSKHTSIAVPALGCGGLKYSPDEVIATIVTEILRCAFLPENEDDEKGCTKRARSKNVKIVVQPDDSDVKEAFIEYFKEYNKPRGDRSIKKYPQAPHCDKREVHLAVACPKTWHETESEYTEISLPSNSYEFCEISDRFKKDLPNSQILEILRIQNKSLYIQFEFQKRRSQKNLQSGRELVQTLWHGTERHVIDQITSNNFNRSFAGKNGTAHGHGCYFSTTASYSDSYSRKRSQTAEKFMILADVITGNYCEGNQGHKTIPDGYHSLVNKVYQPTIFVVFNDCSAYPSYVIKYR